MELWDAYLEDGSLAGRDLVRGQPVPKGLYHLVCCVLVRHADGTYLLMKRAAGKETWPGVYEASAGGSALKGETGEQAARRELYEETGIRAGRLTRLYARKGPHTMYEGVLCRRNGGLPLGNAGRAGANASHRPARLDCAEGLLAVPGP